MGGLTVAATLRQAGFAAVVYEQAGQIARMGAGIQMMPNSLVGVDERAGRVRLSFEDGTDARADAVIVADGVHSIVRDIIAGPDTPLHKGRIAFRAVFPSSRMGGVDVGRSRTKWWGPDRHIVISEAR